MSFAEILFILCAIALLYRLLKPFRVFIELTVLKAMGRKPRWIDADVVPYPEKKKD